MRLTGGRAVLILFALVALFVAAVRTTAPKPIPSGPAKAKGGDDGALFKAVVERVRHGEAYYPAMGEELRRRNYPTASIFNWRTPPLYVLLGLVPSGTEVLFLVAACLVALALTAQHLTESDLVVEVLVGVVGQAAVFIVMASPPARFLAETWSGMAIAISVMAYARRRWIPGAAVGLSALFIRELAAPYCVACVFLAARARRWRELYVWTAGLTTYGILYAVHLSQVQAQHRVGDAAHLSSWVHWGGLAFIQETMRETSGVLLLTPHVIVAAAVVLLAASVLAAIGPTHMRATVIAYGFFFAVVGLPFNDYWGFLTAPSYAVGFAYGTRAVRVLVGAAAGRSPHPHVSPT